MQNPQKIFNRILIHKKRIKDLKDSYKNALKNNFEFLDLEEQIKILREKKKAIELVIQEQFQSEITEIQDLKIDVESDEQVLTDIVLSKMMKGESIEIVDENEDEYEPLVKIKMISTK